MGEADNPVLVEIRGVDGWTGFIEALRRVVEMRELTYENLSELAGLPSRYANKIFCDPPMKNPGRNSFGPLIATLGVKILIVDDPEALAAVQQRFVPRRNGPKRKTRRLLAFEQQL
jgi:hypothetical protein